MSIVHRDPASPTSLGPGLWFLVLGAVVGGLSLFTNGGPAGRVFGAVLAAILIVRGIARVVQARRAAAEDRERSRAGRLGEPGSRGSAAS